MNLDCSNSSKKPTILTLKSFSGRTDMETAVLGRNICHTFLTLAPPPVMQTDAFKTDVVLDVSVFML